MQNQEDFGQPEKIERDGEGGPGKAAGPTGVGSKLRGPVPPAAAELEAAAGDASANDSTASAGDTLDSDE